VYTPAFDIASDLTIAGSGADQLTMGVMAPHPAEFATLSLIASTLRETLFRNTNPPQDLLTDLLDVAGQYLGLAATLA
jgi:hypothetical protein